MAQTMPRSDVAALTWVSRQHLAWLIALIDLLMVSAATVLAVRFRVSLPVFSTAGDILENTALAAGFLALAWVLVLVMFGAYDRDLFGAGIEEYRLVVNGSLATAALIGVLAYLLQFPLSRGFFVLLFVIGLPLLLAGRLFSRRVLQRLRARGKLNRRVILIGTPGYISEIYAVLRRESWLGYRVIGCLVPPDYAGLVETSSGIPVLGLTDSVREAVDAFDADTVFFAGGAASTSTELRRLAWKLEDQAHVQIIVAPSLTDVSSERVRIRPVAGLPLMHLGRPRSAAATSVAKRIFDLVGAATVLILAGPALLILMVWIRLHDSGPAIFRQERVGRDGATFACFKLRSMVLSASDKHQEAVEGHVLFKDPQDPRITRPGRLIRRFSLDELPQLWNVLRGEMSLVGPRPPLANEVARYEDDMLRRLNVVPGMTGLWQVSGRSDLSWEDTMRLDLYYVDNWSMVQDLVILARTVSAVLSSRGAY